VARRSILVACLFAPAKLAPAVFSASIENEEQPNDDEDDDGE